MEDKNIRQNGKRMQGEPREGQDWCNAHFCHPILKDVICLVLTPILRDPFCYIKNQLGGDACYKSPLYSQDLSKYHLYSLVLKFLEL
jgi:hypothetical protein